MVTTDDANGGVAPVQQPTVAGGMDPRNYWAWVIPTMFFEGTMRGIFTLLFGASVVLLTERMEQSGAGIRAADVHFRRMLWMMLFGIIHWALLLWIGEILFAYSIGGLLLFAFRKMAPRFLLMIAGALLLTSVATSMLGHRGLLETREAASLAEGVKATGAKLTKEQEEAIAGWKQANTEFSPKAEDLALLWQISDFWDSLFGGSVIHGEPACGGWRWATIGGMIWRSG